MRRFYSEVGLADDGTVTLDGKPIRTPRKAILRLPTPALGAAVAAEWRAQGEKIDPHAMRLTRLANTAIDRVALERDRTLAEMVDYAGSDLVCYRADRPPELVAVQAVHWDPVVAWAETTLGSPLAIATAVIHREQAPQTMRAVGDRLARRSDFALAALQNIVTLTGSALIALMLDDDALTEERAWTCAHVDEDYQISQWGWDEEARNRRTARLLEFSSSCQFLRLGKS
jgi:chaperone required for assembly of F1-ATPase